MRIWLIAGPETRSLGTDGPEHSGASVGEKGVRHEHERAKMDGEGMHGSMRKTGWYASTPREELGVICRSAGG